MPATEMKENEKKEINELMTKINSNLDKLNGTVRKLFSSMNDLEYELRYEVLANVEDKERKLIKGMFRNIFQILEYQELLIEGNSMKLVDLEFVLNAVKRE